MEPRVDIDRLILTTRQYEFSDGLRDLQIGLTFLFMGAIWYGLMLAPAWIRLILRLDQTYGSWAKWTAIVLVFAIPALVAVGLLRLMEYLRRRWLWPHSGMIKSTRIMVPRSASIASVILFILTLVGGLLVQPVLQTGQFYLWNLIFLASGWGFGLTLVWFGVHIKISRYVILGLSGGLASSAVLLFQSSLIQPALLFSLGWGALLLISGLVVLMRTWTNVREDAHGE